MDARVDKATEPDPSQDEPRDRPFDAWRIPLSERARALIVHVVRSVEGHVLQKGIRKRRSASLGRAIEAVVCDAACHALVRENGQISVTCNRTKLSRRSIYHPRALNKILPRALHWMADLGLLCVDPGHTFRDPNRWKDARQTTFVAGPALLELVQQYGVAPADFGRDQTEPLILLKSKRPAALPGKPKGKAPRLEYDPKSAQVRELHDQMVTVVRWIAKAGLALVEPLPDDLRVDLTKRTLRRHFTRGDRSFRNGGRLFGGWWLDVRRSIRLTRLRINGEPVVSLDFRGMFIALLYPNTGAAMPSDPYSIPGLEAYRKGIKRVMTASLFRETPMTRAPRGTRQYLPNRMPIGEILSRIKHHHAAIARHFDTEVGHRLMNDESNIMVAVLLSLRELGIHALPTHDAVTVARSNAEAVRQVMRSAALEMTGASIEVHIEKVEDVVEEDDDHHWLTKLLES